MTEPNDRTQLLVKALEQISRMKIFDKETNIMTLSAAKYIADEALKAYEQQK